MQRSIIFGTGSTGRSMLNEIREKHEVIGFLDNDKTKWGTYIEGVPVLGDSQVLSNIKFDVIFVCSLPAMYTIKKQLIESGIQEYKINTERVRVQVDARINFLRDFAALYRDESWNSAVAEGGVYQGDFSKEINSCFPDSRLYLFDTFEGFDQRDVLIEETEKYSVLGTKHNGNTSVELVLSKLPYKEKAIIKRGYFPDTTKGIEDERFFFVNLDFDLFNPTIEGLRFFFPRLREKGVILVHDYYNIGYKGVAKAVDEYANETKMGLRLFPIGDHCSIAIEKTI